MPGDKVNSWSRCHRYGADKRSTMAANTVVHRRDLRCLATLPADRQIAVIGRTVTDESKIVAIWKFTVHSVEKWSTLAAVGVCWSVAFKSAAC